MSNVVAWGTILGKFFEVSSRKVYILGEPQKESAFFVANLRLLTFVVSCFFESLCFAQYLWFIPRRIIKIFRILGYCVDHCMFCLPLPLATTAGIPLHCMGFRSWAFYRFLSTCTVPQMADSSTRGVFTTSWIRVFLPVLGLCFRSFPLKMAKILFDFDPLWVGSLRPLQLVDWGGGGCVLYLARSDAQWFSDCFNSGKGNPGSPLQLFFFFDPNCWTFLITG